MDNKDGLWLVLAGAAYILGIATGILVVKDRMEEKYKRIAQEEIESVKEKFSKRNQPPPATPEENDEASEAKRTADKCAEILRGYGYGVGDGDSESGKPYVISPDEFGEFGDYEKISLTYFADGVLTDENNYPLDEDSYELVGRESLTHFGEYEEDSVFVRNDAAKCDYEILLDQRMYADVRETMPPV